MVVESLNLHFRSADGLAEIVLVYVDDCAYDGTEDPNIHWAVFVTLCFHQESDRVYEGMGVLRRDEGIDLMPRSSAANFKACRTDPSSFVPGPNQTIPRSRQE